MELRKSERRKSRIRLGLQGPSGSGKTMSALLIANGLCPYWNKIAVIDTEYSSSDLYSHLGQFNVVNLSEPFNPEKYCEAIRLCERKGMEVIIVDSSTHMWLEILQIHANMPGNSFTNWAKLTPRHNAFVQAILQCKSHVIVTTRSKEDYVLQEKNNKQIPEKVGLKAEQRDGFDYNLTVVFDLDIKNYATASKDRTGLFFGKPEQILGVETGKKIYEWCNQGTDPKKLAKEIIKKIQSAVTIDELMTLFKANPQLQTDLLPHFTARRKELDKTTLPNSKQPTNGTVNKQ